MISLKTTLTEIGAVGTGVAGAVSPGGGGRHARVVLERNDREEGQD
jgi:hypothetical protein